MDVAAAAALGSSPDEADAAQQHYEVAAPHSTGGGVKQKVSNSQTVWRRKALGHCRLLAAAQ